MVKIKEAVLPCVRACGEVCNASVYSSEAGYCWFGSFDTAQRHGEEGDYLHAGSHSLK